MQISINLIFFSQKSKLLNFILDQLVNWEVDFAKIIKNLVFKKKNYFVFKS